MRHLLDQRGGLQVPSGPGGKKIKEPLGEKQQRPIHQRGPILGKATWLTLMLTWREEGTE